MIVGTLSALLLIFLSPTIQVSVLGRASAPFPLKNPGLVTIPLAFVVGMVVSLLAPEHAAAERFTEVQRRVHLGPEADGV
jgi:cation/acetate symporter